MIPPSLMLKAGVLVKEYAGKAVLITIVIVTITGGLVYGHYKIDKGGYDRAKAESAIQLLKSNAIAEAAYQEALDKVFAKNKSNTEKMQNALLTYATREPAVVIKRMLVHAKPTNCTAQDTNSPGPAGSDTDPGSGGSYVEAELSERATRSFERITNDIKEYQKQCLLVSRAQRINQSDGE